MASIRIRPAATARRPLAKPAIARLAALCVLAALGCGDGSESAGSAAAGARDAAAASSSAAPTPVDPRAALDALLRELEDPAHDADGAPRAAAFFDAYSGRLDALLTERVLHLRDLLMLHPSIGRAPMALANASLLVLRQAGLRPAHEPLVKAWKEHPDAFAPPFALGHVAAALNQPDAAILWFGRAMQIAPGRADVHQKLGAALANQGHLAEALQQFDQAVAADPDDLTTCQQRAVLLLEMGKTDEALAGFERASAASDSHVASQANNSVGKILLDRGDRDGALARFQAALAAEPESAAVRYNLAALLVLVGRGADASEHADALERLAPKDPRAPLLRGQIAEERGDAAAAEAEYRAALAKDANCAEARRRLVLLLRQAGRADEAKALEAGGAP